MAPQMASQQLDRQVERSAGRAVQIIETLFMDIARSASLNLHPAAERVPFETTRATTSKSLDGGKIRARCTNEVTTGHSGRADRNTMSRSLTLSDGETSLTITLNYHLSAFYAADESIAGLSVTMKSPGKGSKTLNIYGQSNELRVDSSINDTEKRAVLEILAPRGMDAITKRVQSALAAIASSASVIDLAKCTMSRLAKAAKGS
jgi:hypothetical protein